LGIKLGTPVWEARKICPRIVLLSTDPDKYRSVTERFMGILEDYTDKIERYSIDEAFLDITNAVGCNPSLPPSPRLLSAEAGLKLRGGVPPLKLRGGEGELWNNALMLGLEIKQRIRLEVGKWISCSIGVGPNKLVSKIAADLDGGVVSVIATPSERSESRGKQSQQDRRVRLWRTRDESHFLDRICVIKPEQVGLLYDVLNLTDIPGIGKRYERRLNGLGIHSLLGLAEYPVANLINQFGIAGYFLHELANFRDNTPVIATVSTSLKVALNSVEWATPNERSESRGKQSQRDRRVRLWRTRDDKPKSIGHAYTMPEATRDTDDLRRLMFKLSEKVGRRLRAYGARALIVHYFHGSPSSAPTPVGAPSPAGGEGKRGMNFFSRQKKLPEYIQDSRDIYQAAYSIFKKNPDRSHAVKIMGVSVSGLVYGALPEPLFREFKKPAWLLAAMDRINDTYGEFTIRRARFLGVPDSWAKETVGFGRTKNNEKSG